MDFELHPRLVPVTAPVGDFPLCRVLLFDERRLPWLMLVPRRPGAGALLDLTAAERAQLMEELALVGEALTRLFRPLRLNVADIGNRCPQLHVHVVARFASDPFWPAVAWSRMPYQRYEDDERMDRLKNIACALRADSRFRTMCDGAAPLHRQRLTAHAEGWTIDGPAEADLRS
ncbi:MAG TPA: HIT domain-containing protein [Azospirillum sp.]|nr:HIT domain-containing protein [Azospirillum sp.]